MNTHFSLCFNGNFILNSRGSNLYFFLLRILYFKIFVTFVLSERLFREYLSNWSIFNNCFCSSFHNFWPDICFHFFSAFHPLVNFSYNLGAAFLPIFFLPKILTQAESVEKLLITLSFDKAGPKMLIKLTSYLQSTLNTIVASPKKSTTSLNLNLFFCT